MKFKYHHTALTVNNIEDTIKWYKDNLGFSVTHEYEMYGGKKAILLLDEIRIELFDFGKANKPLPDYRKELMEDLHTIGTKHLSIEVDDLKQTVSSLKNKGVEVRDIAEAGFGGTFTFIKDCNGILIELYQK